MKNNIAEYYKHTYDESKRLCLDNRHRLEFIVKQRIYEHFIGRLHKNAKVLEISCGTGAYTLPLAQQGIDITACDLCEHHIDILNENVKKSGLNVKTFVCNATSLPVPDSQFDMVIVGGALYHLNGDDKVKVINETFRVSKEHSVVLCDFLPKTHAVLQHLFRYKEVKEDVDDGIFYYNDKESIRTLCKCSEFKNNVSFMSVDCVSRFDTPDINKLSDEEIINFADFLWNTVVWNEELVNLSEHAVVCLRKN